MSKDIMDLILPTLYMSMPPARNLEIQTLEIFYKTLDQPFVKAENKGWNLDLHHGLARIYISQLLQRYQPPHSLRSSNKNLLQVPKSNTVTYGDRAFSVCAPKLWNTLSDHIRSAESVNVLTCRVPCPHLCTILCSVRPLLQKLVHLFWCSLSSDVSRAM